MGMPLEINLAMTTIASVPATRGAKGLGNEAFFFMEVNAAGSVLRRELNVAKCTASQEKSQTRNITLGVPEDDGQGIVAGVVMELGGVLGVLDETCCATSRISSWAGHVVVVELLGSALVLQLELEVSVLVVLDVLALDLVHRIDRILDGGSDRSSDNGLEGGWSNSCDCSDLWRKARNNRLYHVWNKCGAHWHTIGIYGGDAELSRSLSDESSLEYGDCHWSWWARGEGLAFEIDLSWHSLREDAMCRIGAVVVRVAWL